MASAHPADQSNPFSGSRGSGAFYEPESSMEDHSTGADISPAAGDFFAKRDRLEKLRSGGGKEDKVATAQREVQDAEEVHTCAKQQYEQVAARVDAEMLRFQREKVSDFKQMMNSFVSMQLEYSERVHHAWRDLLPKIEAGAAAAENAD